MPLDPDIAAQVAHLVDATWVDVLRGDVAGAPVARPMRRDDVEVTDGEVPGPHGPIPVRRYESHRAGAPAPALVWAHGGAWQFGGLDMPEADSVAQMAASAIGGVVLSVDYRLAPLHRHPAALDDVVAAFLWMHREAAAHGVDPGRIALGGASAGGHLAVLAALALIGGDAAPAALALVYPVTDPEGPFDERHPDCPPVLWLGDDVLPGLFDTYVGPEPVADPATAIPSRRDLRGLPPTLVSTAECDALARQAVCFVDALEAAGVEVTHHRVESVLHGYANTVGDEPLATRAVERHLAWLRDHL